jgi:hypothetical protein
VERGGRLTDNATRRLTGRRAEIRRPGEMTLPAQRTVVVATIRY